MEIHPLLDIHSPAYIRFLCSVGCFWFTKQMIVQLLFQDQKYDIILKG